MPAPESAPCTSSGDGIWHVDRSTVRIRHDTAERQPWSTKSLDFAAQRGECERATLWFRHPCQLGNVSIKFSVKGPGAWSVLQVGFVQTTVENADVLCWDLDLGAKLPHRCAAGWWPDPLLDVPLDAEVCLTTCML